jgi:hypothetical protein
MTIFIYHYRKQFIVFNIAQQCYIFRPVQQSLGINAHWFKKQTKCIKTLWNLRDLASVTILVTLKYLVFYFV